MTENRVEMLRTPLVSPAAFTYKPWTADFGRHQPEFVPDGVMVTQQVLILPFQVRVLVG